LERFERADDEGETGLAKLRSRRQRSAQRREARLLKVPAGAPLLSMRSGIAAGSR